MDKKGKIKTSERAFQIILTVLSIILFSYVWYTAIGSEKSDQIVMWSLKEDYCFAVDAPFDGDVFEPGIYHFRNERLSDIRKVAAWEIYASKTPRKNRSELREDESVAIVGGTEDLEYTVDISPGNYIYVKYRGVEERSEANSLVVDWMPSSN
ncbi:hypothetical protein Ami103574_02595 [Aminipila butyrica]|uniref:Uncharacterized protein n=1 Tax=Aminipila butyrica TaxID=433296 RepID=A0A858BT58_9FIRM|nr:hypothetical protein [Aminipila butyrica]QIB68268.1 hypothetical protein Ami103574_02595 [Aminipila butyrica]